MSLTFIKNATIREMYVKQTQQSRNFNFAQGGATFAMNSHLLRALDGIIYTDFCPGNSVFEDVTIGFCSGWFTNGTI
eukprot:3427499-Rhodomonas_salina.1